MAKKQFRRRLAGAALGLVITAALGVAAPAAAADVEPHPPSTSDGTHLPPHGDLGPYTPGDPNMLGHPDMPEGVLAAVTCGVSSGPLWSQWRYFNCSSGPRAVHYLSKVRGNQCMTVQPYQYSAARLKAVDRFQYTHTGVC